jgi:hypothetical protein
MRAYRLASVAFAAVVFVSAAARAGEPNESAGADAESLFQEGRRAMEAKHYAEACPKFLASQKLSPAIGTLLNLADCYEKNGQLASAWTRFHEAISLAQHLGRPEREKTARDHADRLEPRLIRLTILSPDAKAEVKLDGNPIDASVIGTPIPIDPGKHTIEASAKGKKTFTTSIDVSDRAKSPSVEIPELEAQPGAPSPPASSASNLPFTPPPPEPKSSGGTQRTIGVALMVGGVVGLGVGGWFGLETSSKWSDAKTHCTGLECDRTGVELAKDAKTSGNISTIAFIAGGVLAAGGAALFFSAPKRSSASAGVQLGVGPHDVIVRATF